MKKKKQGKGRHKTKSKFNGNSIERAIALFGRA